MFLEVNVNKESKNHCVVKVDSKEKILRCQWASDISGVYCIYKCDSEGYPIREESNCGHNYDYFPQEIKVGNIKFVKQNKNCKKCLNKKYGKPIICNQIKK